MGLRGIYLEQLTWADRITADYLTRRLAERVACVILPTVIYGYPVVAL